MANVVQEGGVWPDPRSPARRHLKSQVGQSAFRAGTSAVEQTHLSKQHLVKHTGMSGIVWMETFDISLDWRTSVCFLHLQGLHHFSLPSSHNCCITCFTWLISRCTFQQQIHAMEICFYISYCTCVVKGFCNVAAAVRCTSYILVNM